MSVKTITVWECDRCGVEHHNPDKSRWGSVDWYVRGGGYGPNGLDEADVCPDCMKDLQRWWEAPKNIAALA